MAEKTIIKRVLSKTQGRGLVVRAYRQRYKLYVIDSLSTFTEAMHDNPNTGAEKKEEREARPKA